ncbi:MAG: M81 family metallopeptidase, partial [bacterium]|nr:M81 family metallopeptidase [bacterium]
MRQLIPVFLMISTALNAQQAKPLIAAGGILHESNSFSAVKTQLEDFQRRGSGSGNELLDQWADSNHEVAGFVVGARQFGLDLYPTLSMEAVPSGPVTDQALDSMTGELIESLRAAPKLDGLLLALHGAM